MLLRQAVHQCPPWLSAASLTALGAVLAAAAAVLATVLFSQTQPKPPVDTQVVVIGAGASGITTAWALGRLGIDRVLVLEADPDRIGGRITTVDIPLPKLPGEEARSIRANIGAAWIHHATGNPLTHLAAQVGCRVTRTSNADAAFFDAEGKRLSDSSSQLMYLNMQDLVNYFIREREVILGREKAGGGANKSDGQENDTNLAQDHEDEEEEEEEDTSLAEELFHLGALENWTREEMSLLELHYFRNIVQDVTNDLMFISSTEFDNELWEGEGRDAFLLDGGLCPFSAWAKDLVLEGSKKLRKGFRVNRVESLRPRSGSDSAKVHVTTEDGEDVSADVAVVTVPIGVLKKMVSDEQNGQEPSLLFEPVLSEEKQEAIDVMGVGRAIRVALLFPYVFWNDTALRHISPVSRESGAAAPFREEDNGQGPESVLLEGEHYEPIGFGHGSHLEFTNQAAYMTGVPVLLAEADGAYAEELAELSDKEIGEILWRRLAKVFGGEEATPRPVDAVAQRYTHHNPLFRGAFSFTAVGATRSLRRIIEAPHGFDGNVLFAGEHTAENASGTINGALLSGLQAASRAACKLGIRNPRRHVPAELFIDSWTPECLAAFGVVDKARKGWQSPTPKHIDLCEKSFFDVHYDCRLDKGSDEIWTPIH